MTWPAGPAPVSPADSAERRDRVRWVLRLVEEALWALGGAARLGRARGAAAAHLSDHHPWTGSGDEPLDRVCARIDILVEHL